MDTMEVRTGDRLDTGNLQLFLQSQFSELPQEKLELSQFSGGHSHLTYCLKKGDVEVVLRRPLAKEAHTIKREFAILSALQPFFKAVPKAYVYVEDPAIIGSEFFLMERKKGIVLDTHFPNDTKQTEKLAHQLSEIMVDSLVELHAIPYKDTPLKKKGKPDGFMERQVYGWLMRYEQVKTTEHAEAVVLIDWLKKQLPSNKEATIIHYDYQINNVMFSNDYTEMKGLLDWERATVGDPLADVGVAMSYWMQADDPEMLVYALGQPSITTQPGFYTRQQFIQRYAEKSGRDISTIHYYCAFAYFKLAVICQQMYDGYIKGQIRDDRFAQMDKMAAVLIQQALTTR
ncbi:phosphotransferase family protein [Lysinibacillus macroides]|uniref:Aminoglycoside phosphotransferase n=1 Tax=Lysinibacillus macroides TaxID=33935 RepID=A0A0M9DJ76_9BACI|nr:phosphotransferase family protein [Lysinibacillus macroides]KOY81526.1 aminoglycoside phosphotransferase [Lysinibacillus macroides]QPR69639.1 phosphotransferase family protein [Lysinibacillus macroides]